VSGTAPATGRKGPERIPVFDVDDFDEARPGPWEWDVCRLAASIVVASRESGGKADSAADAVTRAIDAYSGTIRRLADGPLVLRYYSLERVAERVSEEKKPRYSKLSPGFEELFGDLHVDTQGETVRKMITDDGKGSAFDAKEAAPISDADEGSVVASYSTYLTTLDPSLRRVLDGYSPKCVGERPVGEGSLGLRNYLVKIAGRQPDDGLILQVKEATPSALDTALEAHRAIHEGERVVEMQRTMQAVTDPLLGSTSIDGQAYYVRQFRDGKANPDLLQLDGDQLLQYSALCGATLARAHARSADPRAGTLGMISGYIESDQQKFAAALAEFAERYAEVTRADQEALGASRGRER